MIDALGFFIRFIFRRNFLTSLLLILFHFIQASYMMVTPLQDYKFLNDDQMTTLNATFDPFVETLATNNMPSCTCP